MSTPPNQSLLNTTAFLRLEQIIGNRKKGIPPLIPISRTSFLNRVRSGEYPQPINITEGTKGWRTEDIRQLVESKIPKR